LLRRRVPPRDPQYDAFEATLAQAAARILALRAELVRRLDRVVGPALESLAGGKDHLRLVYEPGFPAESKVTLDAVEAMPPPHLEDILRRHWREARSGDAERGLTRHGPHRDDMRFDLNGVDARPYASQGQARSCVLALRLAELDLLAEDPDRQPLLLMDDILGELDAARTEHFLHLVARREVQTLLTATDAARLEENLPVERRFRVVAGKVTRSDPPSGSA
jgi:DNA replication and repair protein RecF